MPSHSLATTIEALLFYKGEPMKRAALARTLGVDESTLSEALVSLTESLKGRGIVLVTEGDYVGLATAPEAAAVIETLRKEELEGPLGKAGLETLAIVIYHGPLSKADIEYIRGVNCASILRSLTMRGLVERIEHPTDKRSFLYRPTPELPAALGLSSTSDAPEFEAIRTRIQEVLDARDAEPTADTPETTSDV